MTRTRAALAGAAAATIWAAAEPLDIALFRYGYSDTAMLGKLATRSRLWPLAGLAIHAVNGVAFGLAFREVQRRSGIGPRKLALGMALAENTALYPLAWVVDRVHPARGTRGVAPMFTKTAFAQETLRHGVFGLALGRFAS